MYDPSIGRWLQEDPIGFDAGDVNLYRYTKNNPVSERDPSGLLSVGAELAKIVKPAPQVSGNEERDTWRQQHAVELAEAIRQRDVRIGIHRLLNIGVPFENWRMDVREQVRDAEQYYRNRVVSINQYYGRLYWNSYLREAEANERMLPKPINGPTSLNETLIPPGLIPSDLWIRTEPREIQSFVRGAVDFWRRTGSIRPEAGITRDPAEPGFGPRIGGARLNRLGVRIEIPLPLRLP
jgi:hypothetical protein